MVLSFRQVQNIIKEIWSLKRLLDQKIVVNFTLRTLESPSKWQYHVRSTRKRQAVTQHEWQRAVPRFPCACIDKLSRVQSRLAPWIWDKTRTFITSNNGFIQYDEHPCVNYSNCNYVFSIFYLFFIIDLTNVIKWQILLKQSTNAVHISWCVYATHFRTQYPLEFLSLSSACVVKVFSVIVR